MSTSARYYLSAEHGLVDLWEHPEWGPEPKMTREEALAAIQWHREATWEPAFYDFEDDCWFTMRHYEYEGKVVIESINLSPLRTAPERFDAYPSLHPVIYNALEAEDATR